MLRSAPGTARGRASERVGARSQQLHPLLNKPGFRSDHPGVWRLYFREGFCGSKSWESGTAHFEVPSLLALWARVARRLSGDPVPMPQGFLGLEGLFFYAVGVAELDGSAGVQPDPQAIGCGMAEPEGLGLQGSAPTARQLVSPGHGSGNSLPN